MDNATIDTEINDHLQRLQDLNNQMVELSKKIGSLQEEGRALHSRALEVKGAIDALVALKAKQEAKAKEKAAGLILADKSLVAADGKTVIADVNAAPAAPADGTEHTPAATGPTAPERNEDGSLKFPLEVVK